MIAGNQSTERKEADQRPLLPNLCGEQNVLTVMLIAELLAISLALAHSEPMFPWLQRLFLYSLYVQWVALTSAVLLCLGRHQLARLSNVSCALTSCMLITAVTLVVGIVFRQLFFEIQPEWWGNVSAPSDFLLRGCLISAIFSALILRYMYVQQQWRLRIESETRARVQNLQARLRPHFLFNTMNTIAALVRTQPELAETLIEDLCELLRTSLRDRSQINTLQNELKLCHCYLRMETLRLGERLQVAWEMENLPENAYLPALSLQPLLENAIYHGIEQLPGGGLIQISGQRQNSTLEIRVCNPLPEGLGQAHGSGQRIALESIRARIESSYGSRGTLQIHDDGRQFQAVLRFPYHKG